MSYPRAFTVWSINEYTMSQQWRGDYPGEEAAIERANNEVKGKRSFYRAEVHTWTGVKVHEARGGK